LDGLNISRSRIDRIDIGMPGSRIYIHGHVLTAIFTCRKFAALHFEQHNDVGVNAEQLPHALFHATSVASMPRAFGAIGLHIPACNSKRITEIYGWSATASPIDLHWLSHLQASPADAL
jgi:hypothetical protein